jgi:HK97 family phage major capsid protein
LAHGRVRAEQTPAQIVSELRTSIEQFKAKHNERVDALQTGLDEHSMTIAALRLNGGQNSPAGFTPPDPEYSRLFAAHFRHGTNEAELRAANTTGDRMRVQAAMSSGSAGDGGFLTPVEWDRRILEAQRAISPMRTVATVQPTAVGAYSTLWNDNQFGSGWVGETALRPATSTPKLSALVFPTGELYAQPAVTQTVLDDAQIDLDKWLADHVSAEFGRQEGIAFVAGDGVNKPMGFLQYVPGGAAAAAVRDGNGNVITPGQSGAHPGGNLDVVPSGNATQITSDALVDMLYGLAAPYRQNACWYMSSPTAGTMSKLKDGQGNYLWRESYIVGQPQTILGRPVVIDESMPDVKAGSLPIAFGDFRAGYVINDRFGTRIIRDQYTNKPFVMLYATKRVGGGLQDPRAIRVMKIAAS